MKETEQASCSRQTQTGSERNYATRGRCLPTSVFFTPRGRIMAYGFLPDSRRICMMRAIVGRSWTEYMSSRDHRGQA